MKFFLKKIFNEALIITNSFWYFCGATIAPTARKSKGRNQV